MFYHPDNFFVALLWTLSHRSMFFLCWGPPAGCNVPGGVSAEQTRGTEHPPSSSWPHFHWCSQGHIWAAQACWWLMSSLSSISILQVLSGASLSLFHPPACIDTRDRPNPSAAPWLFWSHPCKTELHLCSRPSVDCLFIYFLPLSLTSRPWLSHAGPLPLVVI